MLIWPSTVERPAALTNASIVVREIRNRNGSLPSSSGGLTFERLLQRPKRVLENTHELSQKALVIRTNQLGSSPSEPDYTTESSNAQTKSMFRRSA